MSQRLFLVRHGRAEAQAQGGDAARRLTPEGRAAFEAHVRALGASLAVNRVVTSPVTRARETAQIIAAVTGARAVPDAELSAGNLDGRGVLRLAGRLGPGVALVGHNPELADAVSSIAGRRVDLPPGGIAALDVAGKDLRLAWIRVP